MNRHVDSAKRGRKISEKMFEEGECAVCTRAADSMCDKCYVPFCSDECLRKSMLPGHAHGIWYGWIRRERHLRAEAVKALFADMLEEQDTDDEAHVGVRHQIALKHKLKHRREAKPPEKEGEHEAKPAEEEEKEQEEKEGEHEHKHKHRHRSKSPEGKCGGGGDDDP